TVIDPNGATVTQSGELSVKATTTVNARAISITLTQAPHDFPLFPYTTLFRSQISDANALTLGTLNTGDLTATANADGASSGTLNLGQGHVTAALVATSNNGTTAGTVTQSGGLTVTGTSSVNAGASSITLTQAT